jgi:hypothetical protein
VNFAVLKHKSKTMIYSAALTLHIIGIAMFAGSSFIDYLITEQFWSIYNTEQNNASVVYGLINKIQKIAAWGGRFIIVAGIVMVSLRPVWLSQTWFQVKMGILILLLVNGSFRQKLGKPFQLLVSGINAQVNIAVIRSRVKKLQIISMILVILMFALSVFKFN